LTERNSRAAPAMRTVSPTAASSNRSRNPGRCSGWTRLEVAGSSNTRGPADR
jgi:hypothetical protein